MCVSVSLQMCKITFPDVMKQLHSMNSVHMLSPWYCVFFNAK